MNHQQVSRYDDKKSKGKSAAFDEIFSVSSEEAELTYRIKQVG